MRISALPFRHVIPVPLGNPPAFLREKKFLRPDSRTLLWASRLSPFPIVEPPPRQARQIQNAAPCLQAVFSAWIISDLLHPTPSNRGSLPAKFRALSRPLQLEPPPLSATPNTAYSKQNLICFLLQIQHFLETGTIPPI